MDIVSERRKSKRTMKKRDTKDRRGEKKEQ
jgi:hypothetical protein